MALQLLTLLSVQCELIPYSSAVLMAERFYWYCPFPNMPYILGTSELHIQCHTYFSVALDYQYSHYSSQTIYSNIESKYNVSVLYIEVKYQTT